jgi:DNA repair exonuclease SbcCD ATPase subunit
VDLALENAINHRKSLEFRLSEHNKKKSLPRLFMVESQPEPKAPEFVPPSPELTSKTIQLRDLKTRYTDKHPDVIRLTREVAELELRDAAAAAARARMAKASQPADPGKSGGPSALQLEGAEIQREMESNRNEIARREKEKQDLLTQIKIYEDRLSAAPAVEQELTALMRKQDAVRQQHGTLQNKKLQAQLTSRLEVGRASEMFRVIDEANLPERPTWPDRSEIKLLGLLAGFVLGIAAALGRELLDDSLGTEREASAVLDLPVLVSIPKITDESSKSAGFWSRKKKEPVLKKPA